MNLQEKINADLKTAMLNKDAETRDMLRVVIGEINRSPNIKNLEDKDVITIMKKLHEDATSLNNKIETSILERYLPTKIDDDTLKDSIINIITTNGYSTIKDVGKIMSELKNLYGQAFDGSTAGRIAKEQLNVK